MLDHLSTRFQILAFLIGLTILTSCHPNKSGNTSEQEDSEVSLEQGLSDLEKNENGWPYDCIQGSKDKLIKLRGNFESMPRYTDASNPGLTLAFGDAAPNPNRMKGLDVSFTVVSRHDEPFESQFEFRGKTKYHENNTPTGSLKWGGKTINETFSRTLQPGENTLTFYVDTRTEVKSEGIGGALGLAFGALLTGEAKKASNMEETVFIDWTEPESADKKEFDRAMADDSLEALHAYLIPGKERTFRDQAVKKAEKLRERAYHRQFLTSPSISGLRSYIKYGQRLHELSPTSFESNRFTKLVELAELLKRDQLSEADYRKLLGKNQDGVWYQYLNLIPDQWKIERPVALAAPHTENDIVKSASIFYDFHRFRFKSLAATADRQKEEIERQTSNTRKPLFHDFFSEEAPLSPNLKTLIRPKKSEYESQTQFEDRAQALSDSVSARNRDALKSHEDLLASYRERRQNSEKAFQLAISRWNTETDNLQEKIRIRYIAPSAFESLQKFLGALWRERHEVIFDLYDAEQEELGFTITIGNDANFSFRGRLILPGEEARVIKEGEKTKVHLHLLPSDEGNLSKFYFTIKTEDSQLKTKAFTSHRLIGYQLDKSPQQVEDEYLTPDFARVGTQVIPSYLKESWHTGQYLDEGTFLIAAKEDHRSPLAQLQSIENYLKKFPSGKHLSEAEKILAIKKAASLKDLHASGRKKEDFERVMKHLPEIPYSYTQFFTSRSTSNAPSIARLMTFLALPVDDETAQLEVSSKNSSILTHKNLPLEFDFSPVEISKIEVSSWQALVDVSDLDQGRLLIRRLMERTPILGGGEETDWKFYTEKLSQRGSLGNKDYSYCAQRKILLSFQSLASNQVLMTITRDHEEIPGEVLSQEDFDPSKKKEKPQNTAQLLSFRQEFEMEKRKASEAIKELEEARALLSLPDDETIKRMGAAQVRYAINEIYARRGVDFQGTKIHSWFRNKSWYRPTAGKTADMAERELTSKEKTTIEKLAERRTALTLKPTENTRKIPFAVPVNPQVLDLIMKSINPDQVRQLDYAKVRYLINTIYAYHGVEFKDKKIQAWANQQAWYHKVHERTYGDAEALFTPVTKENIEILAAWRNRLRLLGKDK